MPDFISQAVSDLSGLGDFGECLVAVGALLRETWPFLPLMSLQNMMTCSGVLSVPATGAGPGEITPGTRRFIRKIGQAYFPGSVSGSREHSPPFPTASVVSAVFFWFFFVQGGRLCYRRFDNTVLIRLPRIGPSACVPYFYLLKVFASQSSSYLDFVPVTLGDF